MTQVETVANVYLSIENIELPLLTLLLVGVYCINRWIDFSSMF